MYFLSFLPSRPKKVVEGSVAAFLISSRFLVIHEIWNSVPIPVRDYFNRNSTIYSQ